jgi:hypothetical protein
MPRALLRVLLLFAALFEHGAAPLPQHQQQRRTVVGCHECAWSDEWNLDAGFLHYNFSLLSQLNFHSAASLLPNGSLVQAGIDAVPSRSQCDISDANASSVFQQIRARCEANDVRLVLSIGQPATTAAEMLAFLSDGDATQRAIQELSAAAAARRVGGLSLDWEGSYEFDVNGKSKIGGQPLRVCAQIIPPLPCVLNPNGMLCVAGSYFGAGCLLQRPASLAPHGRAQRHAHLHHRWVFQPALGNALCRYPRPRRRRGPGLPHVL